MNLIVSGVQKSVISSHKKKSFLLWRQIQDYVAEPLDPTAPLPSIFWQIEKQSKICSIQWHYCLPPPPDFQTFLWPCVVCTRVNKKSNQTFRIYLVLAIQIDLIFEAFHCDLCRKKTTFLGPSFCTWHKYNNVSH